MSRATDIDSLFSLFAHLWQYDPYNWCCCFSDLMFHFRTNR